LIDDRLAGGVVLPPPPGAEYPFVERDPPQPESANVRKLRKLKERANFA